MNRAGHWAYVFDAGMRYVFATDEIRRSANGLHGLAPVPLGAFRFGTEAYDVTSDWGLYGDRSTSDAAYLETFIESFDLTLAVFDGDRGALRSACHPIFFDLVDTLPERPPLPGYSHQEEKGVAWGINIGSWYTTLQVRDDSGAVAGYVRLGKPAAGMSLVGTVASVGDVRHLERMQDVVTAERRPAAILFADLEASSTLSKTLSTSEYFSLARRMVRAADEAVVGAGGLVGRHLGDGVTAFFLVETLGSESAAARACIEAARSLKSAMPAIAARSNIEPSDLVLRFGLHWGSTLYVGLIKSIARSEVTAMGDEVNEAARIEACAQGGLTLASKALVERLNRKDADDLGIGAVSYTLLADLKNATEKARRDAPAIAVCEL